MESGSASEKRAKPVSKRESFRHFVVRNQNDLHWLFTASFLIVLGNWFTATQGYFEFEEHNMRAMVSLLNALAPTFAIVSCIFRSKIERHAIAATAIFTLLAILFQAHIATITCFILLICFWIPKNSELTYVFLALFQGIALLPIIWELTPEYNTIQEVSVDSHRYTLYQQQQLVVFFGKTNSLHIAERTHLPLGLRLVKSPYYLIDEYSQLQDERFKLRVANAPRGCIYLIAIDRLGKESQKLVNLKVQSHNLWESAHFDRLPSHELRK